MIFAVSPVEKSEQLVGYLLDTNFFDLAKTNDQLTRFIAGRAVYSTHVQQTEISGTGNQAIRAVLLSAYKAVGPEILPTHTAPWDDTPWDVSLWSSNDGLYDRLLRTIVDMDKAAKKKSREPFNQSRDARIAETALRSALTLVTDDPGLTAATRENGGAVISVSEFCAFSKQENA